MCSPHMHQDRPSPCWKDECSLEEFNFHRDMLFPVFFAAAQYLEGALSFPETTSTETASFLSRFARLQNEQSRGLGGTYSNETPIGRCACFRITLSRQLIDGKVKTHEVYPKVASGVAVMKTIHFRSRSPSDHCHLGEWIESGYIECPNTHEGSPSLPILFSVPCSTCVQYFALHRHLRLHKTRFPLLSRFSCQVCWFF